MGLQISRWWIREEGRWRLGSSHAMRDGTLPPIMPSTQRSDLGAGEHPKRYETSVVRWRLWTAALLLAVSTACSSVDWSPDPKPPFAASQIGPEAFRVEVNLPEISPAPGSLFILCATAQLAVDHDRRFFTFTDRAKLDRGRGSFTVRLEESAAEGVPIVDFESLGGEPSEEMAESARYDAPSVVATCRRLGLDAHHFGA